MTFFITGLICWGYVLLGEVKHGGHMLILTILPTVAIIFIWQRCGGKPGKVAQSIVGQIILAGIFNGLIMLLLGSGGIYLGIPLNLLLLTAIIYVRIQDAAQPKPESNYLRGYRDGATKR